MESKDLPDPCFDSIQPVAYKGAGEFVPISPESVTGPIEDRESGVREVVQHFPVLAIPEGSILPTEEKQ
ncbi:MAG: hypothetical protein L3K17_05490, partial [Thermoplasmata archaeon]|nr:hypothetical protein [Thermoplasmata archaeon]